jgi:hypothetical protein
LFQKLREMSDHYASYIFIHFEALPFNTYKRCVWNYKNADFVRLNELINSYNWSILINGTVDEASNLFTSSFLDLTKRCIPYKEVTIRQTMVRSYNTKNFP